MALKISNHWRLYLQDVVFELLNERFVRLLKSAYEILCRLLHGTIMTVFICMSSKSGKVRTLSHNHVRSNTLRIGLIERQLQVFSKRTLYETRTSQHNENLR